MRVTDGSGFGDPVEHALVWVPKRRGTICPDTPWDFKVNPNRIWHGSQNFWFNVNHAKLTYQLAPNRVLSV